MLLLREVLLVERGHTLLVDNAMKQRKMLEMNVPLGHTHTNKNVDAHRKNQKRRKKKPKQKPEDEKLIASLPFSFLFFSLDPVFCCCSFTVLL